MFSCLECGSNRIPLVMIVLDDIAVLVKVFSDFFILFLFTCY
jgi:hypothetical protein